MHCVVIGSSRIWIRIRFSNRTGWLCRPTRTTFRCHCHSPYSVRLARKVYLGRHVFWCWPVGCGPVSCAMCHVSYDVCAEILQLLRLSSPSPYLHAQYCIPVTNQRARCIWAYRELSTAPTGGCSPPPHKKNFLTPATPSATGCVKSS